jgi:phenylacetate-CoA ligase
MTVEVETRAAEAGPALAEALRHHLKSRIGLTCEIAVKAPGAVPRSQGKAVRVRDLRGKAS